MAGPDGRPLALNRDMRHEQLLRVERELRALRRGISWLALAVTAATLVGVLR